MNINFYELATKEKKEKKNAFVVNIMVAATNEFIHTHAHVESGRGRFMRVRARACSLARAFFDLFSSCSVHQPLPPSPLLLLQLLHNRFSSSYKSMMRKGVGNRKRRNIVTISVLGVRIQTLARALAPVLCVL